MLDRAKDIPRADFPVTVDPRRPRPELGPRWARGIGLTWLAALLFLTLRPAPDTLTPAGVCILCGERGLADAILNVLLFLPAGIVLRARGLGLRTILAGSLVLSAGIESTQFFLPGRDASIGDVLFNTTGGCMGALCTPFLASLVNPTSRRARRLAYGWAALLLAYGVVLAWLLAHGSPEGPLRLELRPEAPEGGRFEGRVLRTLVDGVPVEDGTALGRFDSAYRRIAIRFTAVPHRWAYRPLLAVRSTLSDQSAWLTLGPKGEDLTLRIHRAASRLRLTPPDLQLRGALRDASPGDTVVAGFERRGDAYCLHVDSRSACEVGYTVGSGWALLLPTNWADGGQARWLDALWLAALLVPLGYWEGHRCGRPILLTVVAAAALLLPSVTSLMAAPAWNLPGLLLGWGAGWTAAWIMRSPARIDAPGHQQIPS